MDGLRLKRLILSIEKRKALYLKLWNLRSLRDDCLIYDLSNCSISSLELIKFHPARSNICDSLGKSSLRETNLDFDNDLSGTRLPSILLSMINNTPLLYSLLKLFLETSKVVRLMLFRSWLFEFSSKRYFVLETFQLFCLVWKFCNVDNLSIIYYYTSEFFLKERIIRILRIFFDIYLL